MTAGIVWVCGILVIMETIIESRKLDPVKEVLTKIDKMFRPWHVGDKVLVLDWWKLIRIERWTNYIGDTEDRYLGEFQTSRCPFSERSKFTFQNERTGELIYEVPRDWLVYEEVN